MSGSAVLERPDGLMERASDPGVTAPALPIVVSSPTVTPTPTPHKPSSSRTSARQSGRGTYRSPRVPLSTRRALRAELHSAGLTLTHAARLLGIRLGTLDALLSGRQHVSSRLGYHQWPSHVQTLCDQMRQSNTILARHLDAAAHEIAASGLPLPAFVGGNGTRTRPARKTGTVGHAGTAGHMVSAAPRTSRKRVG